jgi:hypothetical protein
MEQMAQYLIGLLHLSPALVSMVLGILFLVSEGLAYIPSVKSNGVFQLIQNLIVGLKDKLGGGEKKL